MSLVITGTRIMLIKKKSLIVAVVSSLVISIVLVMTVISYLLYTEMRNGKFLAYYEDAIRRTSARTYAKQIDFFRLKAVIGRDGAFKGRPMVEGVLVNNGNRAISDMLVRIKFRDTDGAVIYEVVFHPQEPALGISILDQVPIPCLAEPHRISVDPGDRLAFKRILSDCPKEIVSALKETGGRKAAENKGWAGTLEPEILSMEF